MSDDYWQDDVPEYRPPEIPVGKIVGEDAVRQAAWRAKNRDVYNARQRELMRAKRLYEKENREK